MAMSEIILDMDLIIRRNLLRILEKKKISQSDLAKKIKVAPTVINDIVKGRRNLSKAIMGRICDELDIEPWQFTIMDVAPVLTDENDSKLLSMMREAERLGVAEEIVSYGKFKIQEAKNKVETADELKIRVSKHLKRLGIEEREKAETSSHGHTEGRSASAGKKKAS